jgi:hypothetical protein
MTTHGPESPSDWLLRLAPCSARTWDAAARRAFAGEASLETAHTLYRFKEAGFVSRLKKPARSFDAPKAMRGLRLLGFLVDEGGFWSLSTRWSEGAHAVLWRPPAEDAPASFSITSPSASFAAEEPIAEPKRDRPSGVQPRAARRPPTLRMLEAPSMTRIHAASG